MKAFISTPTVVDDTGTDPVAAFFGAVFHPDGTYFRTFQVRIPITASATLASLRGQINTYMPIDGYDFTISTFVFLDSIGIL